MSDQRIFLQDDPPPSGAGPWLVVVIAAIVLTGAALVLSDREPAHDNAIVQRPLPTFASTTSTTVPATTTTTEPPLLLEQLVPAFDRTLNLIYLTDTGLAATKWRVGSAPVTVDHPIGSVSWADFDASGELLGAATVNSSRQSVVWLGSTSSLEPMLIAEGATSVIFHAELPGHVALASTTDQVTMVRTFRLDLRDGLFELGSHELAGSWNLVAWSQAGVFLTADEDGQPVTWIRSGGDITDLSAHVPPQSGAPLFLEADRAPPVSSFTVEGSTTTDLPENTVSLSPLSSYAIVDTPFEHLLVDLGDEATLAFPDAVGLTADWSPDERWFVYVSDIDSFRIRPLTRFVFVDAVNGSAVSVSLRDDQLGRPATIAVSY